MKKWISLLYIIYFVICLSSFGCAKKETEGAVISTDSEVDNIVYSDAVFSLRDSSELKKQYPDKTILRWLCPNISERISEVLPAFNQRLDEKGYDFAVDIIPTQGLNYKDYIGLLTSLYESKTELDIFNVGFNIYGNEFSYLLSKDMCTPLNPYLELEEGNQLYQQYSENAWTAVSSDGLIYSIPVLDSASARNNYTICINIEMAEKYQIDKQRFMSDTDYFWQSVEMVNQQEEAAGITDFYPLILDEYTFSAGNLNYLPPDDLIPLIEDSIIGFRVEDDGNVKAVDLLEDPRVVNGILSYFRLYNNNRLLILSDNPERSGFSSLDDPEVKEILEKNHWFASILPRDTQLSSALSFNRRMWIENRENNMNCISSWSRNKESAFQLLNLVYTDPELSNLLGYGIEGTHYTIENGEVCITPDYSYASIMMRMFLCNPSLLLPEKQSELSMTTLSPLSENDYKNNSFSPLFGKRIDYSGFNEDFCIVQDIRFGNTRLTGLEEIVKSDETLRDYLDQLIQGENKVLIRSVLEQINMRLREMGLQW